MAEDRRRARRRFKTSAIELDITQRCNLRCNNCTRRCDLFKGQGSDISVDSIAHFTEESQRVAHPWLRIFLMGGEPTLHPNLLDIVRVLLDYKKRANPAVILCLVSNCFAQESREITDEVESMGCEVRRSVKTKELTTDFWTMNVAPMDFAEFDGVDYGVGCGQQIRCGLERYIDGKYYGCAMAGGIDRAFQFGVGKDTLAEILKEEVRREQFQVLCGLCGRFRIRYWLRPSGKPLETDFTHPDKRTMFQHSLIEYPHKSNKRILSKTWEEIVKKIEGGQNGN